MLTLKDVLPDSEQEKEEYQITRNTEASKDDIDLLDWCRNAWDELQDVRNEFIRNRKFVSGDQWSDLVPNPANTNQSITEKQLILNQGRQPIVNNQIQKISRSMLGQFRDNDYKATVQARTPEKAETTEMMTNALQYVYDKEELQELDTREFEAFLKHSMPGYKVDWGWNVMMQEYGVNVDLINLHRIFFNTDVEDVRMKDLRMIGEIHDMIPEEVVKTFAKGDKLKEEIISDWIGGIRNSNWTYDQQFNPTSADSMDFYIPEDHNKVRVIEVWYKEKHLRAILHDYLSGESEIHPLSINEAQAEVDIENQQRKELALSEGLSEGDIPPIELQVEEVDVWFVKYLTVDGHCLYKGETPFEHNEHPYVLRPYPMVDREVIPFISTIIDQQKYINRLITMMDFMLGAGAKGVLLVNEDALPEGTSIDHVADKWHKFNSVIAMKPKQGQTMDQLAKQIYSNSQSVAGEKMLALQLQLLKEISGVNDAIQGQKVSGVNTASQYAQMSNNAAISSKDYFEHFSNVRKLRDKKIVQVIMQYWDKKRYINVSGADYENEAYMFDPEKVQGGEYDIVIGKSGNSPVYRQQMDEYLFQFLQGGLIDLSLFLEHTSLPFAQKLRQSLAERQEAMQGINTALGDPQAQEIMNGVDPQTQDLFNQALQVG